MSTEVCVGNLPISATEAALALKFVKFGIVLSVRLEGASNSAKAQRRAFVEMQTSSQAQRAINGLNRADYDGRVISACRTVPVARQRIAEYRQATRKGEL